MEGAGLLAGQELGDRSPFCWGGVVGDLRGGGDHDAVNRFDLACVGTGERETPTREHIVSGHRTILTVAAAALLATAAPAVAQDAADVDVVDSDFVPGDVTIDAGGTVTWTQSGSLPHTVTADDGSFDSHPDCSGGTDCMSTGDTFAHTFDEPGEYAYYCRIHGGPGGVGMSGVVVVTAAGSETPTAEPTTEEPTTDAPTEEEGTTVTGDISVADQSGDGTSITVASATITGADGFVVVHLDEGGAPGPILGHAAIPEGTSTDVQVPLDETLTSDVTVWPMLHVDAGTLGTYEFPGADTPVSVDGSVVMAPLDFTLAASGSESREPEDDELPATGVPLAGLALFVGLATAGGGLLVRRTSRDRAIP